MAARSTRHSGLKREARRLACFSPADWISTELFLVDGEEESLISRVLVVGVDLVLMDEAADLLEVEKNISAVCCLCWMRNMFLREVERLFGVWVKWV